MSEYTYQPYINPFIYLIHTGFKSHLLRKVLQGYTAGVIATFGYNLRLGCTFRIGTSIWISFDTGLLHTTLQAGT